MRPCILARHLKPARESFHIIDPPLSLAASRVYVIEKLLAYLREGGQKDGRTEGGRVRVSVHVHMHVLTCMDTHTQRSYGTFRFMLMHVHATHKPCPEH